MKEARVQELLSLTLARDDVSVPSAELRALIGYAIGCRKAEAERDFARISLKRVLERLDEVLALKLSDDDDTLRSSDSSHSPEATDLQGRQEA
jgi:hypothetical protein